MKIAEVPIIFTDRFQGTSKMSRKIVWKPWPWCGAFGFKVGSVVRRGNKSEVLVPGLISGEMQSVGTAQFPGFRRKDKCERARFSGINYPGFLTG